MTGQYDAEVEWLLTDSRSLCFPETTLFFAIRTERGDGHRYIQDLYSRGVRAFVVSALQENLPGAVQLLVPDTLTALQRLAERHREEFDIPVIGITGSNGKTTTKELVRAVLSAKYNVTATEGNLNNSIGVPLTLLKVNSETQIAVVEMGASHPGDIKELVDIACPNFGLITNVGKAHLLGFGSFEGVKATKGELYDYLRRTADKAFINVDNPHLCQMASDRNMQHDPERSESLLIPYGLEYQGAKVLPSSAEEPFLRIELDGRVINTNLVGYGQVHVAVDAAALVPPTLKLLCVNVNRNNIFLIVRHTGNVANLKLIELFLKAFLTFAKFHRNS